MYCLCLPVSQNQHSDDPCVASLFEDCIVLTPEYTSGLGCRVVQGSPCVLVYEALICLLLGYRIGIVEEAAQTMAGLFLHKVKSATGEGSIYVEDRKGQAVSVPSWDMRGPSWEAELTVYLLLLILGAKEVHCPLFVPRKIMPSGFFGKYGVPRSAPCEVKRVSRVWGCTKIHQGAKRAEGKGTIRKEKRRTLLPFVIMRGHYG